MNQSSSSQDNASRSLKWLIWTVTFAIICPLVPLLLGIIVDVEGETFWSMFKDGTIIIVVVGILGAVFADFMIHKQSLDGSKKMFFAFFLLMLGFNLVTLFIIEFSDWINIEFGRQVINEKFIVGYSIFILIATLINSYLFKKALL